MEKTICHECKSTYGLIRGVGKWKEEWVCSYCLQKALEKLRTAVEKALGSHYERPREPIYGCVCSTCVALKEGMGRQVCST